MECVLFVGFMWALLVVPWAVWKASAWQIDQARQAAARRRRAAEDRIEARRRQVREQEAAEARARQRRDQRRREDARARCEAFFSLHAPELGRRFTRAMFDSYVIRYMGNSLPPDEVEQRADQLCALLKSHLEKVMPTPEFRSLGAIAAWFEEQQQQLEALPDDQLRESMLARLKARYAELTEAFLEGI